MKITERHEDGFEFTCEIEAIDLIQQIMQHCVYSDLHMILTKVLATYAEIGTNKKDIENRIRYILDSIY